MKVDHCVYVNVLEINVNSMPTVLHMPAASPIGPDTWEGKFLARSVSWAPQPLLCRPISHSQDLSMDIRISALGASFSSAPSQS